MEIQRKNVLSRGNSKCKGPKVRVCLMHWRNSRACVARGQKGRVVGQEARQEPPATSCRTLLAIVRTLAFVMSEIYPTLICPQKLCLVLFRKSIRIHNSTAWALYTESQPLTNKYFNLLSAVHVIQKMPWQMSSVLGQVLLLCPEPLDKSQVLHSSLAKSKSNGRSKKLHSVGEEWFWRLEASVDKKTQI